MPFYECLTTEGTLDGGQRDRFAQAVTDIHTGETGGPAKFVLVNFQETRDGTLYMAGKRTPLVVIRGRIRAGRPPAVRHAIMKRLSAAYAEITGTPETHVTVTVMESEPTATMKAGELLPAADKAAEEAWFAKTGW